MSGPLAGRIAHYCSEVPNCLRLGKRASDRWRLMWNCAGFHAANILRVRPRSGRKNFRVRLGKVSADLMLRSYTGDLFVFQEVLGLESYHMLLPGTRGVIVDLGANIGLASLYFADRYDPSRLICVEPNPKNIPLLTHNLNVLGKKVEIVQAAISDSAGMVSFDTEAPTWGGKIVAAGDLVPSLGMTEFIQRFVYPDRIRLLKIDIEGGEHLMFQGDCEWLKVVDCIIIELHSGFSLDDFTSVVSAYGLTVYPAGSRYSNALPIAVRGGECQVSG